MGIYCLKKCVNFVTTSIFSMVSKQIFPLEMATLRWPIPPIPRSPNMNRWDSLTRSEMRQQIWHRNIYKYHIYINIILYYIVLYCIILYYIILYYIVLYCIILYYIVLYCIILYYIILYYIVLYYIILYCIILYYIVLYYILLYYVPSGKRLHNYGKIHHLE